LPLASQAASCRSMAAVALPTVAAKSRSRVSRASLGWW
jgi:hypothetical protein